MRPSRAPGARGFTLIEVVLATALLAAGLALAYATLGAATGSVHGAERAIERTDRVRAVQGFLRRQIQAARPAPFDRDPDSGQPIAFRGERDGIEFVSAMPGHLARGGMHWQQLRLVPDAGALRLEFDHRLVLGGVLVDEGDARPPEVLMRGIERAEFQFRLLDQDARLGDWVSHHDLPPGQLPVMVALRVEFADAQRWPALEIALQMSGPAVIGGEVP